jgi:hypothetical protein
MKKVLQVVIAVLSLQGYSFAKDCSLYEKVLLPDVIGYCLVAEGILRPKEAFQLNTYYLLNKEEEIEFTRKKIYPTIADMKDFIWKNGGCENITSIWNKKSYSGWCFTNKPPRSFF